MPSESNFSKVTEKTGEMAFQLPQRLMIVADYSLCLQRTWDFSHLCSFCSYLFVICRCTDLSKSSHGYVSRKARLLWMGYLCAAISNNKQYESTSHRRAICKHFLPKNHVGLFFHSRRTEAVVLVKEPDKIEEKIFSIFKMARFTSQNGPFCSPKWIILLTEMGHFEV